MPTYIYETIPQNPDEVPERFEVKQSMREDALKEQPGTGARFAASSAAVSQSPKNWRLRYPRPGIVARPVIETKSPGPFHRSVVVAVVAVGMVEAAIDEIIDVVAVRYCLVSAIGTVVMSVVVGAGVVRRGASVRIGICHVEGVFLHRAVRILVMKVAVVQVIEVIAVADRGVAAAVAVLVVVVFVDVGITHDEGG